MSAFRALTDLLTNVMELAIFLFGLQRWELLDRSRRLLTAWAGCAVLAAAGTWALRDDRGYSHVMEQLALPLSALFALGALAAMQDTRRRRDVLRIVGALYAVTWALLTLGFEDLGNSTVLTGPIHHVLLTGGSAFTLQVALRRVHGDLLSDPGAVVGLGFLAIAAPTAVMHPVMTLSRNEPTIDTLVSARNVVALLGYAALVHAVSLPSFRRAPIEVLA